MRRVARLWPLPFLALDGCGQILELDGKTFGPHSGGTNSEAGSDAGGTPGSGGAALGPGGSPSGEAGQGGAAGNGGAPGSAGGSAGNGGSTCVDVGAELCMRPPWPAGIVPYARGEYIPDDLWANIETVITWEWEDILIRDASLNFVKEAQPGVPTLTFTRGESCGPVARSSDAVTVALAACPGAISRVIGIALGLPPMHRRADRDRYLDLAAPDDFDCTQGLFFERCADLDGVPALLGPFDVTTLMFAPSKVTESATSCALKPEGDYLYLPHEPSSFGTPRCSWASSSDSRPGRLEQSAIAELYAMQDGWQPFAPVGIDLGPDQPLNMAMGPGMNASQLAALVSTDGESLTALAFDNDPAGFVVRAIQNDDQGWGQWTEVDQDSSYSKATILGATRRAGASGLADLLLWDNDDDVLRLSTYDRNTQKLEHSTNLGPLPLALPYPDDVPYVITMAADTNGIISIFTDGASQEDYLDPSRIFELRYDGSSWSEWQPIEHDVDIVSTLAAAATDDGTLHLVAWSLFGLRYASRTDGVWSSWSALTQTEPFYFGYSVRIALLALGEKLVLLGNADQSPHAFQRECEANCEQPDAWSAPKIIGPAFTAAVAPTPERIDVVSVFGGTTGVAEALDYGMWHKRWVARIAP